MSSNISHVKKGLLFVVSAPAGTGKSTLVDKLTAENRRVKRSISCTTRAPRSGEVEGRHYHFLSQEDFEKKVAENAFLEHVTLFGYSYGTLREDVEKMLSEGFHVVLVIDTQGALHLMNMLSAVFIFIMPPSLEVLSERLLMRKTEDKESIKKRLSEVEREMSCAKEYDYIIVNDDIDTAYIVLKSICVAEEHRVI